MHCTLGSRARGNLAGNLVAVVALSTASCGGPGTSLPAYASPHGRVLDQSEGVQGDVIRYRQLEREDFRAAEPPPEYAPHREKIGAATCAYLVTRPDMRIELARVSAPSGPPVYRAAPIGVGFQALMNRDCSWWNTDQTRLPADYVLEHEQIHFALFEILAERLDQRSAELTRAATVTSNDPEEAASLAYTKLESELALALGEVMQRQREFDEDTSMGFRPERQAVWLQKVRVELEQARRTREAIHRE